MGGVIRKLSHCGTLFSLVNKASFFPRFILALNSFPQGLAVLRTVTYISRHAEHGVMRNELLAGGAMASLRLNEEQRRYFYELCATGNITKAAQNLYLTRQGLSLSMRELEKMVGVALFTRHKRGVELTEAGQMLLTFLRQEDDAWNRCLDELRNLDTPKPETVRVGLLSMFVGYEEKRRLLSYFEPSDTVRIEIVDGDHDAFWRQIAQGELDFAVTMRPPDHWGLPSIRLTDDALSVLISCDDPLAAQSSVDFSRDLCGRTVVQTSPYKGRLFETVFRNHGLRSEAILHDKNLMLAQVSTRQHVFIIQSSYAQGLVTDEVCQRPLRNAPLDLASVFVFRDSLSPQALAVARVIVGHYGKADELDRYFAREEKREDA